MEESNRSNVNISAGKVANFKILIWKWNAICQRRRHTNGDIRWGYVQFILRLKCQRWPIAIRRRQTKTCLIHDTRPADLIALWQNKSTIKPARLPAPDNEGLVDGWGWMGKYNYIWKKTKQDEKSELLIGSGSPIVAFVFSWDIDSYLGDILKTASRVTWMWRSQLAPSEISAR